MVSKLEAMDNREAMVKHRASQMVQAGQAKVWAEATNKDKHPVTAAKVGVVSKATILTVDEYNHCALDGQKKTLNEFLSLHHGSTLLNSFSTGKMR